MRNIILFAFIAVASADTLVLKDGAQLEGTMVSASTRTITFVDSVGQKREYDVSAIQEIRFERDTSDSRNRTQAPATAWETIDRLNDDIARAVERSSLSLRQRQLLDEAQTVLTRAARDLRDNKNPKNKEVRRALDNVRYVMNSPSVRTQDRRAVLDGIAQLREQHKDFNLSR
jgi:hypothetical protein